LQAQIQAGLGDLKEIPKAQRRSPGKPLNHYFANFPDAKEGMKEAYSSGDYTLQQITDAFGVHYQQLVEQ